MGYFSRADGAGFYTFDTSKAKAMTAASFKRSTMEIDSIKDQNPLLWFSVPSVIPGNALPSPGGRPSMKNGNCIGGIGAKKDIVLRAKVLTGNELILFIIVPNLPAFLLSS